jgi:hypothetical protein
MNFGESKSTKDDSINEQSRGASLRSLNKGGLDLGDTFNMPHFHEMDFAAAVKRWPGEGCQMGTANKE